MVRLKDQLGREVVLKQWPTRIISLVPSQTELLFDLGIEKEVVGITKFCVHPEEWLETKVRVGGTKNFHFDKIDALKPDLIIANKEENNREDIERLEAQYPVYVSDVNAYSEALGMIQDVGVLTGKSFEAEKLVQEIEQAKQAFESSQLETKTAVYFIWREPWMVAGDSTFINEMILLAGFKNLILDERYPEISLEKLKVLNPDEVLLSTEPYPFKEEHVKELQELFLNSKVKLVDGEYFSWYGSRMKDAFDYFKTI